MLFTTLRRSPLLTLKPSTRFYSIKPDIKLISKIRQKTEVSISKAKESLIANENDFEKALLWLEQDLIKSGQKKAEKLANRVAGEGLIGFDVVNGDKSGASLVELCCETDFVTRSPMFQQIVNSISKKVNENNILGKQQIKFSLEDATIKQLNLNESKVNDIISEGIAKLGENIQLRRNTNSSFINQGNNKVYVQGHAHNGTSTNGKIAGYIALRVQGDTQDEIKLNKVTKQLARHVVGLNPEYLNENEYAVIENKKQLSKEEYDIFLKEKVLLNQTFLFGQESVSQFLNQLQNELKVNIEIVTFARLVAGEGIQKEVGDFKDEVMKQVKKFN